MKNKIVTLIFTLGVINMGYSQFGKLKNLKKKASSLSSKISKKDDDKKIAKFTENADGRPSNDANNPNYAKYLNAKTNIKYTETAFEEEWNKNPEGTNNDIIGYLKNIKKSLDFLKSNGEEEKKYFIELDKKYNEYLAKRESLNNSSQNVKTYESILKQYESWITFGKMNLNFKRELLGKEYPATYKGYNKFKEDFKREYPDAYNSNEPKQFDDSNQSKLAKVDKFFTEEVNELIPSLEEKSKQLKLETNKKNSSNEESYKLNAKIYQTKYAELIEDINYHKETFFENPEKINALLAEVKKEKSILDAYIDSGAYDKKNAEYNQASLDKIRMGKVGMKNPALEKKAIDGSSHLGKVLRVVITSSSWSVKKNGYGLPLYKFLSVDIAYKHKDGTCYLGSGSIRKEYEGGGKYSSSSYFKYFATNDKMNCDNVFK